MAKAQKIKFDTTIKPKRIRRTAKEIADDARWNAMWKFVRDRLDVLRKDFKQEFGPGGGCDYYIFNSLN